ncbi:MAG: sulfurtransferase [Balneolaceae bacterium]|nr:sulfurtransferase [Balneolaceae bacterium]
MKKSYTFILLLFVFIYTGCSGSTNETESLEHYPNADLLVEADELQTMLSDENLLLIDARSNTTGPFVPEAVHFAAIPELADPNHPIPNFLIGPELFQEKMRSIGLNQEDRVVIMDEGNSLAASRLFYALEYYGFSNASLVNGGYAAWMENDYPTVEESRNVSMEGNFTTTVQESRFCDFETVMAASSDPDKIVFDVRSEGEYTGETERAEKNGHIPNAIHLEWSQVIESEGVPYFKSANEIQELYSAAGLTPDKEIIPHCQTNNRGAHAYFTLRLMGYDSVRPYEASWAEYGNREDSVVE